MNSERDKKIQEVIERIVDYGTGMDAKKREFAVQQREAGEWMSTGFWVKAEPQE